MSDKDLDALAETDAFELPRKHTVHGLPYAMLRRAVGSRIRAFTTTSPLFVVVRVTERKMVEPIVAAAKLLGKWRIVFDGDSDHRHAGGHVDEALSVLAAGERVLCVAASDETLVPLLATAIDMTVHVGNIELADVSAAIKLVTGSAPRGLKPSDIVDLDIATASACIRADTTAAACVVKLRARVGTPEKAERPIKPPPLLSELHGYGAAQDWANALVADLERWRAGELEISELRRHAVLAGPPGVGKSTFVRSVAAAAGLPLVATSVGQLFASTHGYLDSIVKGIDRVFSEARKAGPAAMIFFDEIEGVPSRASLSAREASWWTPVVTHLLTKLDSALSDDTSNLVVVGATNFPDRLDAALVRSGRLDRIIYIGLPDEASLEGIYRQHLGSDLPDADLGAVATLALGCSGADVVAHIAGARARARSAARPLEVADIVEEICPPASMPAEEAWRAAVHESGHALVATLLGTGEIKSLALGGGAGIGGRMVSISKSSLLSGAAAKRGQVMQLLAGRAAEEAVFGHASGAAGGTASSDLARASNIVAAAHLSFGLRGSLVFAADFEDALTVARRTPSVLAAVDAELRELYLSSLDLLRNNEVALLALAERLLRERVLSGTQVADTLASTLVGIEGGLDA